MDIGVLIAQIFLVGSFSAWCTVVFDAICESIKHGKDW